MIIKFLLCTLRSLGVYKLIYMIKKEILNKILWATIEDYVGTWEILWELNTIFPNNSKVDNKIVAKKILIYFFNEGLINFYKSVWGAPNSKFEKVNVDNINSFLMNEKLWKPVNLNEECVLLSNTQKGKEFYSQEKLKYLD